MNMGKIKKAAQLLDRVTEACPQDTSRSDCAEIDGWEPKQGCDKRCGEEGRSGSGTTAWKCWRDWLRGKP